MKYNQSHNRGAVSIFVVLFTALLVTIVTAGFIQLMLRNQEQATNNDLAQSAYDSALAGVEDAKRSLVKLRQCENDTADSCEASIESALNTNSCESLGQNGAQVTNFDPQGEARVGSPRLNQAYSCVKVTLDTASVEDDLAANEDGQVVPLRGVSDYDSVRISWFRIDDMPSTGAAPTYTVNSSRLVPASSWPATQPSVLRTQLIQFSKGDIVLPRFDDKNNTFALTKFLYPSQAGLDTAAFASDFRFADDSRNSPDLTRCAPNFTSTDYLCSTTISIPAVANREAYLQVAAFYNNTHYKLELLSGGSVVNFDNVQPVVDATGRASDLFRRVKARISVTDNGSKLQFPDAALSVRDDLCKDFFVTNDRNVGYLPDTDGEPCNPTN